MKRADIKVELIDHMGSDLSVINSARVSMGKWHEEFDERDEKLINYLANNGHWSPFAHAFLSFRIKAPIFVARQLVKHQIGLSWNEVSRRYVDDEPEFYIPSPRERAENVKQGSKSNEINDSFVAEDEMEYICERALLSYNFLLEKNVAPEVARAVLPLCTMTEWVWSGSLMAFIRVCKLRLDSHAQEETREVAKRIFDALNCRFPRATCAYFLNEEKK